MPEQTEKQKSFTIKINPELGLKALDLLYHSNLLVSPITCKSGTI
jgi:hypothetical protein